MNKKRERGRKLTAVSLFHYFRLVYRSVLFVLLLIAYIAFRVQGRTDLMTQVDRRPAIVSILFLVFTVEMVLP